MRTKDEVTEKLRELKSDERLGYPYATIAENAPLALVQTSLKSQARALRWILDGDAIAIKKINAQLIANTLAYMIVTLRYGVDQQYAQEWIAKAEGQIKLLENQPQ